MDWWTPSRFRFHLVSLNDQRFDNQRDSAAPFVSSPDLQPSERSDGDINLANLKSQIEPRPGKKKYVVLGVYIIVVYNVL